MSLPKGQNEDIRAIRKKIAEHGLEPVEVLIDMPDGQVRSVNASRILIVLEILFDKAKDRNLGAAREYLDRMLGKPKESLSITDDSEGIGKLTDDQLIEKIITAVKANGEAGARKSD